MDAWEYRVEKLEFDEAEQAAVYNRLGAQGWELVSTHAARKRGLLRNPDVLTYVVAIFKRPASA
jgi:hypothetical protein